MYKLLVAIWVFLYYILNLIKQSVHKKRVVGKRLLSGLGMIIFQCKKSQITPKTVTHGNLFVMPCWYTDRHLWPAYFCKHSVQSLTSSVSMNLWIKFLWLYYKLLWGWTVIEQIQEERERETEMRSERERRHLTGAEKCALWWWTATLLHVYDFMLYANNISATERFTDYKKKRKKIFVLANTLKWYFLLISLWYKSNGCFHLYKCGNRIILLFLFWVGERMKTTDEAQWHKLLQANKRSIRSYSCFIIHVPVLQRTAAGRRHGCAWLHC